MERKCTWVRVHVDSRPMYMYLLLLYSTIPFYLLRYNGNEIKLGLSFCCTFETKLVLLISIIRLKMNYGYPWEEKKTWLIVVYSHTKQRRTRDRDQNMATGQSEIYTDLKNKEAQNDTKTKKLGSKIEPCFSWTPRYTQKLKHALNTRLTYCRNYQS